MGREKRASREEILKTGKDALLALIMPIIIIGGILSGIFTATESGAIACAYAIIIGGFVYKELKWKNMFSLLVDCAKSTGQVLVVVACASLFTWVITVAQVPQTVSALLSESIHSSVLLLLIINIILLIAGTFIDTIVICTLTGLSIVITGAWQVEGIEGVAVTTYAFQNGLPFPAQVSSFVLMLCLVFFAFTTILGWDYYSERCLEYLSGGNMKHVKIYRWIYILAVFIGPYMTVSAVWTIADIFNGLMALPNMIALFALSGVVVKETKSFFERHKNQKL